MAKKHRNLLLASLLFPVLLSAQEFPLHITPEGHILIEVKLADSISGNFILDTGAGANVLSATIFEKIKQQATQAGYFTGFRHDGDRLDGEVFEIPYLAIGEVKQMKPIVGIYPPLDDFGIDGLLSLKFFEHCPFTINFSNQKLTILTLEEARTLNQQYPSVPISCYQHTNILLDIFISIQVNDHLSMLAEFDTGSGYDTYILHPNYIEDLKLDTSKVSTQAYTTQISREERTDYLYQLASLAVGPEKAEEVNVIFREGLIHNALIGSGLFKNRSITIDIPGRSFIIHD